MLIPRRTLITGAAALAAHEALAVPGLKPMGGFFSTKGATTSWNPADAAANFTFSNNNLTWSNSTTNRTVRATSSRASGKVYFEFTIAATGVFVRVGLATSALPLGTPLGGDVASNSIGYSSGGGYYLANHATSGFAALVAGDVVGVAFDAGSNLVWFAKNGVWQNTGTPASGSGGMSLNAGTYYAATSTGASGSGASGGTANFGQSAFAYTPPSGFVAWG